jgi:hypothetical protein
VGNESITQITLLQALWNNYGNIVRFYVPSHQQYYIAKLVNLTPVAHHPQGWSGSIGHQRKCNSYLIERAFYQKYAPSLPKDCKVAHCYGAKINREWLCILLSDLDHKPNTAQNGENLHKKNTDHHQSYAQRYTSLTPAKTLSTLSWLAQFHAHFYQVNAPDLWQQGTYWHLATRQQEFNSMADGPLKKNAHQIDALLQQCPHKTLVHGDAKVANFCYSTPLDKTLKNETDNSTGGEVAAVDFQYVGLGIGVQDVAYFLGSCLSEEELLSHTPWCLEHYFTYLQAALAKTHGLAIANDVCRSWQQLYPMACADFNRFLAGWNPNHWKLNRALAQQTRQALELISKQPSNEY